MTFLHPSSRIARVLAALSIIIGLVTVAHPADASNHVPIGNFETATTTASAITVGGWTIDLDTTAPIDVAVTIDAKPIATLVASSLRPDVASIYRYFGPNHGFASTFTVAAGGHTVCATAISTLGGADLAMGCKRVYTQMLPIGHAEGAYQIAGGIAVRGWAWDPNSSAASAVRVIEDGRTIASGSTTVARPDVAAAFPGARSAVGFLVAAPVTIGGLHTFCVTTSKVAANGVLTTVSLGCVRLFVQVNPVGVFRSIAARLVSSAVVVEGWTYDPQSNSPVVLEIWIDGAVAMHTPANLAVPGLPLYYAGLTNQHGFRIAFNLNAGPHKVCVTAFNIGAGPNLSLGCQTTPAIPPIAPVTTPALVSTSRYIRNINGTAADIPTTQAMGGVDASYNPSGHRYLTLLQIGGQTTTGIVLSATSTYVSYAQTVTALKGYIDGYASQQRVNAPAILAIGTNNDIDVRAATGAIWATQLINPLRAYAAKYPNITIAGANDIEPGFVGSMAASMQWVAGYLASTPAPFVFNGSADGCSWTSHTSRCNNGRTSAGMAWVAGAASPSRILSLPQIYNYTMAAQWKYISLTAVVSGTTRTTFAGPLTEWTACYAQSSGCGSLSNNEAWTALWNQIRSDSRTWQASMTYGTDLRIN